MSKLVVSSSVKDKVAMLLAETNPDFIVTGKLLNKGLQSDAKLSVFLLESKTKQHKLKGMSILSDAAKQGRIIETILAESAGSGFTSVEQKQAQIITLLGADLDALVERKRLEVTNNGRSVLSESQKTELAAALISYRNYLVSSVKPQIESLALTLGVMEEQKATTPAAPVAELVVI